MINLLYKAWGNIEEGWEERIQKPEMGRAAGVMLCSGYDLAVMTTAAVTPTRSVEDQASQKFQCGWAVLPRSHL